MVWQSKVRHSEACLSPGRPGFKSRPTAMRITETSSIQQYMLPIDRGIYLHLKVFFNNWLTCLKIDLRGYLSNVFLPSLLLFSQFTLDLFFMFDLLAQFSLGVKTHTF